MPPSLTRQFLPLAFTFLLGGTALPADPPSPASTPPQGAGPTYSADTPIDPQHARAVMEKARSGATLTADEQAYLDRVRKMLKERAAGKGGSNPAPAPQTPPSATEDAGWEQLPDGTYGKALDYTGTGGITLPGYVRKPSGRGPFPAIVFLHGGMAYPRGQGSMVKQGQTTTSPIEDFLKQGWVVYAIDYRHADSPVASVLDPTEIDDSVAAVQTLQKQPFVDPARLGIMGGSHGAQLSSRLISRVNLKGAVICAPACFELPETKKAVAAGAPINKIVTTIIAAAESKYGKPLEEVAKDPAKYGYKSAFTEIPDVKCAVLLVNGKNDDNSLYGVVNMYADKLRAAGKQAETYFPDNGPHGFYTGHPDIPEYQESIRLAVAFFKKQFAADGREAVPGVPSPLRIVRRARGANAGF